MLACSVVKRLHEIQNVAILHIEKASEARLGLGLRHWILDIYDLNIGSEFDILINKWRAEVS